jgi:uncharacterized protein with von Willebrand factor type A (vWA) domain
MAPDESTVDVTRDAVLTALSQLVWNLRAEDVAVPGDGALVAGRAVAAVGLDEKARVRAALQAVLLTDPNDIDRFDRVFRQFWHTLQALETGAEPASPGGDAADRPSDVFAPLGGDAGGHTGSSSGHDEVNTGEDSVERRRRRRVGREPTAVESESEHVRPSGASQVGLPEPLEADHDHLVSASVDEAVEALGRALAGLRDRRWQRGRGSPDVRRALREGIGTGGIPVSIPERTRQREAVRATVLVDVSRSVLDTVDREFLIAVLRSMAVHWRGARVFLFDTDLKEVTTAIDARTATDAVSALERAETAWGGGTQIGSAFSTVRERYPAAVDRRTAVFVVSDGLETGTLDKLARGATWLARRAGMVLWLNPLAADPEFEPRVRGISTVEPYIEGHFAFASPGDIREIARQLTRHGVGGPLGFQYDPRRTATD